jgi:uncharacterized membrane protein (DUF4010 family)
MEINPAVPTLLVQFAMTVVFSFLVGLEFRRYHHNADYKLHFGSTRTFVLIGILGFILYTLDTSRLLYAMGLLIISAFLWIFYWRQFSLLGTLFALLIYLIGPIAGSFPLWFLVLFSVLLILMLGEKPRIHHISDQLANEEIVTLAKFLIISGVILPLLPDQPIAPLLPVSYYKIWLAAIVVSGFSYLGYLINRYFFKNRSLAITGLLAGLYSSTAATIIIARRARGMEQAERNVSSALIMATIMMYLRLLAIIFLFDQRIGQVLLIPFLTLIFLSLLMIIGLLYFRNQGPVLHDDINMEHPLELSTAILFALSIVLFIFLTQYVTQHFGSRGLSFLAFSAGLTDIDPFIFSLLSGRFTVPDASLISAIIIASGSNNLLKAAYAIALARNRSIRFGVIWLLFLFVISILYVIK